MNQYLRKKSPLPGREVSREQDIHGDAWNKLHGGYFSDPDIASPLIREITRIMQDVHPEVLVDLAGGTGYILDELIKYNRNRDMRLVNIDLSGRQLSHGSGPGISRMRACISDLRRGEIDSPDKRFLYIMRSAFHYFGKDGIPSLLQHLRSQMKPGEFFIHQTASFALRRNADCMNSLYQQMGTEKWYPTVKGLRTLLKNTGWSVVSVSRAPDLTLSSGELALRYGLSGDTVMRIRNTVTDQDGEIEDVVVRMPKGFCAYLHYYIYTCIAV